MRSPRSLARLLVVAILLWNSSGAADQHFEPGSDKARWLIKTSLPTGPTPTKVKHTVELGQILKLDLPDSVNGRDTRWQTERIPKFANPLNIAEGEIIAVEGYVRMVRADGDGDYHIQLARGHANNEESYECLIVEVPRPEERFVKDAKLRDVLAPVRMWVREKLLESKEPSSYRGSLMKGPAYVRVVGQAFYDGWHTGGARGRRGCTSPTLWEVHPVTDLRFATAPQ